MSINGNANFDPRFRPQTGGFDDAPDVVQYDGRDRSAAGAKGELLSFQRGPQALIAQQAFKDPTIASLHIVEKEVPSVFDELGDHLTPESNLSTLAKVDLMSAMLKEDARRKKVATGQAEQEVLDAYAASRRKMTTHAASVQQSSGSIINLPVDKKPGKYGPIRKPSVTVES